MFCDEKVKLESGFYFSSGVNVNPIRGIESVEASLNYIYKDDFGVGAGAQYDLQS